MTELEKLIEHFCPDGVVYEEIGTLSKPLSPTIKIKSKDYLECGKYPIIDQGQDFIGGYTDLENVFPKDEYIVFGDHTCVVKYVDFSFAQGADGVKVIQPNTSRVTTKYLYYCMKKVKLDTKYARHWSKMKIQKVPVPPVEIQLEIVHILDIFTYQVSELQKSLNEEICKLQKQYEYYRDKLLTFKEIK